VSDSAGKSAPKVVRPAGIDLRAAEEVRRQEVSRVLGRMDFSPEEGKALERMSRSLVDGLLRGPISEAMRCAGDQQRPTAPRRGR
jgi:glutamyl-tRNA reductase